MDEIRYLGYTIVVSHDNDAKPRSMSNMSIVYSHRSFAPEGDNVEEYYGNPVDWLVDQVVDSMSKVKCKGVMDKLIASARASAPLPYRERNRGMAMAVGRAVEELMPHFDGVIRPLYLLVHSGTSISITPFSDKDDSGLLGFIYMTRKRMAELYSHVTKEEDRVQLVSNIISHEIYTYNKIINDEMYLIDIMDEDGEYVSTIDWIFSDDMDEAIEDAKTEVRNMVKPTLYDELKDADLITDTHESDLYVLARPETDKILSRHPDASYTKFTDKRTGYASYDIAFANQPYWLNKERGNHGVTKSN